ncbi:P-type ATPase [Heterostelium album PN500]|uniref:Calcium-transporting ATPase n=1 Tax=Heterostelium pallidum (strain ATCC 26659 / Pp 5 / PN500) TaxID=670386 RepID=D3BT92_HETP5|nr:P-type ATPase [Heterostelium album PN500]EFA75309.1 P-type ATPase [Heterostelium album PN500]|eukprot:XP_020427443.1 P-type ATPase [Heterostelium album PN500]
MSELQSIGLDPMTEEFKVDLKTLGELVDVPKNPELLKELGGPTGLAEALKTSIKNGLPNEQNSTETHRIEKYGKNVLPPPPHQPLYSIILDALSDHILILLIVAAVVSIVLGAIPYTSDDPKTGWIDGVAILVAVIIVVAVTSTNDYKNQARFRDLNEKTSDKQIKAIRSGEQCQISIFDVRVGDIIQLDTGDIVCADGVFVEGHSINCDESSITGESNPIKKGFTEDGLDPFFISGSLVLEGFGKMLVTAVGVNSFNGKTMMSLRVESEDTPLQEKLGVLAGNIGKFGLSAAVLLLLIVIPKYFIERKVNHEDIPSSAASDITRMVIGAITIIVVAVPEGLPLAVTMALAYGMLKMYKENNLVRHLASCETMGSATNICSDKTGTLTQNVMTVVTGYVGSLFEDCAAFASAAPKDLASVLTDGIAINSNAYEGVSTKGKVEFIGSKTECALLNFGKLFGSDYQEVRRRLEIRELYPFSSARKRMGVLVQNDAKTLRFYQKGASEIVLAQCDRYIDQDGQVQPISNAVRQMFEETINNFATDALRTIGLAYRDFPADSSIDFKKEAPETNLIYIGIVGIKDPLRPEVPDAVRTCQRAGITVRMVTGDNIVTARNIAKNCGILTDDGICMEGPKFRNLSRDEMDAILPRLQVLARSSPTDKQLLVGRLKDLGEVVAVTGDGTNDGPALKLANVGFSMGIAGTEVAIAASDVVLLDDNFASIVRAVLWGRNIYDAICKFLQFQLTVNVVAVTIAFVGTISGGGHSPLTAVQLLWVNLIMDTLAALALATEPPTPDLLDRPPNGKNAPLITRYMWKNIIGQSVLQLVILFVLLYKGHDIYSNFVDYNITKNSVHHYTILFNTFVFLQLFNEINSRLLSAKVNPFKGILNNPIFVVVLAATVVIQVLFVTFGSTATSTDQLKIQEWAACIITGAVALPWGLMLRLIPIKEAPVSKALPETSETIYTPPVDTSLPSTNNASNETAATIAKSPETTTISSSVDNSSETTQLVELQSKPEDNQSSSGGDLPLSVPHQVPSNDNERRNSVTEPPVDVGRGWQLVRQTHQKIRVVNAFKNYQKTNENSSIVDVVRRPTRSSIYLPSNPSSQ